MTAGDQAFTASYHLWLEDVQWTGKGTTNDIPAPKLKVAKSDADTKDKRFGLLVGKLDPTKNRVLVWEMPKGAKDRIDGYILYRKYTCPGQDPATVPELITNRILDALLIDPISEPVGCDAEYRVSAYGRAGESAPSNAVSAKTASSVAVVQVSFDELKGLKKQSSSVHLVANEHRRRSEKTFMSGTRKLNDIPFNGTTGDNVIPVHLNKGDSLQLLVMLFDESDPTNPTRSCEVMHTISPKDGWEGVKNMPVTLDSGDLKGCTAEITLNGRAVEAGEEIRPVADVSPEKIVSVGRDIYVQLYNDGPNDLPSNQIKLRAAMGKKGGGRMSLCRPSPVGGLRKIVTRG